MSHFEKVQKLFAALGASVGFDDMGKDGQVMYRMDYSDNFTINIDYMEESNRMVLAAPMLELPGAENIDAYVDLLELNLYWDELAGARFALVNSDKMVLLVRQLDVAACTEESFVKDATAFIDSANIWYDTLTGKFADEDVGVDENENGDFLKV